MEKVIYKDLGRISYREAWDLQTSLHKELVDRKLENRARSKKGEDLVPQRHYLLFCEHPPVYTLGKSGSLDHLLLNEDDLTEQGFEFFKINRGGDITYHGPGQLVAYPMLDLRRRGIGIRRLVHEMEQAVIDQLAGYGIGAARRDAAPGVYVDGRKIAALGLRVRRGCTFHGLAFNVAMDLSPFTRIDPCGYAGLEVTQVSDLGGPADLETVGADFVAAFRRVLRYSEGVGDENPGKMP